MPRPTTELQNPGHQINNPTDLARNMKFYSIIGHGSIPPRETGTLFLVPEKTYIMFIARAGESTDKIKPEVDEILDAFRYKRPDETVEQWHHRTFEGMENGTLFRNLLYDLGRVDNSKRVSIYQPGDLIQNLTFVLENTMPPWDPVGIWQLPLDPSVNAALQTARNEFSRLQEELYTTDDATREIVQQMRLYFENLRNSIAVAAIGLVEARGLSVNSNVGQVAMNLLTREEIHLVDDIEAMLLRSHILPHDEIKAIKLRLMPEDGPDLLHTFLQDRQHKLLSELNKRLYVKIVELAQRNMIAQTAFDRMPGNQMYLLSARFFDTPRQSSVYSLIHHSGLEGTYRFFLFDICRSLEERPYPVVKKLVRRLSNVMRFNEAALAGFEREAAAIAEREAAAKAAAEAAAKAAAEAAAAGAGDGPAAAGAGAGPAAPAPVARVAPVAPKPQFKTLLKLTKKEIQKLFDSAPPYTTVEKVSTLQTLLDGGQVTYRDFERMFGTFEQWEGAFEEFVSFHRFNENDKAIVKYEVEPTQNIFKQLNNKTVTITGFRVFRPRFQGSLEYFYYTVKEKPDSREIPIPARNLWHSPEQYREGMAMRERVRQEKTNINAAIARIEGEQQRQTEHLKILASSEVPSQTRFALNQRVRIIDMPEGHTDKNGLIGFIVSAKIQALTPNAAGKVKSILVYRVKIETDGPYYNREFNIRYYNLEAIREGGKRRAKTSKKRSKRKQTRRVSK